MSEGRRECYFKATTEYRGKWYCRKCYSKLIRAAQSIRPKPKPKSEVINPAGRLSASDLTKLYRNVKSYQESGGTVDAYSSKVLINEILPSLLLEVMRLRGIDPPEER